MRGSRQCKAFTLIELVVVIAVLMEGSPVLNGS
jgi:type II secretory pathway pseudopilin PulG